jgi:sec-independent protein translocase protein TatB
MFDIGWSELLIIGFLAVLIIKPDDLPFALRQLGRWVGQLRAALKPYQQQWQQLADDKEIDHIANQRLQEMRDKEEEE